MELLKDKDEEQIMKKCYELCETVGWESKRLYGKTDLQLYEIRDYVKKYIENVLKRSPKKEEIWFILESKDKVLFNTYNDIIKLMLKGKVISYEQIKNVNWISDNLRDLICKFCYDVEEKLNWLSSDVKKYCETNGIYFTSVVNLSKEYIDRVLKWDDSQKSEHLENRQENRIKRNREELRQNPSGYARILSDILKSENTEEIIEIIDNSGKDFYSLKVYVRDYLIVYHDSSNEVKKQLLSKFEVYEDYFNKKKQVEREQLLEQKEEHKKEVIARKLVTVQKIINEYLDCEYEKIDDYCEKIGLDRKIFDKCVNIIKEYDEELYNKYLQKQDGLQRNRFATVLSKATKILKLIKEGINEDGQTREFDLVDYYKYTKLTFEELLHVTKGKLNAADYRILRTFIAKNQNDKTMSPLDISNLYNTKIVVGAQFDKNRNIIPGTGREITKEEKENIINYLKSNNIPVTKKTYNIIYKRWLSGSLVLEQEKDKTK